MSAIINHHTHHKLSFTDRLRVLYHGTIDVYSGLELDQEREPKIINNPCTLVIERINLI